MLEISIFLSSFENLSIHYINGPNIFFANLIGRQYNQVHLENDPENFSQKWAQLLHPAQIKNIGTVITAEKLNDFLLSKPKSEFLDCFAGSSF